ncbi:hypothetical protein VLK31_33425 [Variovorax sp. H27-G14]|uniref:DUF7657 domain-containing protein n=1 Tax=Variovorax sp. H27-G14 TaxID=3111914 RepID=UPI0038FD384B
MRIKSIYIFAAFAFALAVNGWIYVSNHWSPSSYGLILQMIGEQNTGLLYGTSRAIRSDELAVVTPLTQATVRNNFERYNATSFYDEDLRINYGLPVFDWGLIFKPTFWTYTFLQPASAFSFHWFAIGAMFFIGHALLFRKTGLPALSAAFLSIGLYFTPFTQFWWNEKGPIFAFFPWVIGSLFLSIPWGLRLVFFYWLSTSWLLTNFYPPIIISLAFVGGILILAFQREWMQPKRLLPLLATVVAAASTAGIYLKDYLTATSNTIYPGQRILSGGSIPSLEWWAQFFPFITFDNAFVSLTNQNICEVGVVGAAFLLMTLCMLNWRRLLTLLIASKEQRLNFSILLAGLVLMNAWMLLPLPSWAGSPLLWNHVLPERMEYAAGWLLLLSIALLGENGGILINKYRLLLYTMVALGGWLTIKLSSNNFSFNTEFIRAQSGDLISIPFLIVSLLVTYAIRANKNYAILAASAGAGAVVLFAFNPIQSSEPIFAQHSTPFLNSLATQIQEPAGVLVPQHPTLPGAALNGLGYRSVVHVTPVPALEMWRSLYPHLSREELDSTFNRYSHIHLTTDETPKSPQEDVVNVPLKDFPLTRVLSPAKNTKR